MLGLPSVAPPVALESVMFTVFEPLVKPRSRIVMLTFLVLESPAAQLSVWTMLV